MAPILLRALPRQPGPAVIVQAGDALYEAAHAGVVMQVAALQGAPPTVQAQARAAWAIR